MITFPIGLEYYFPSCWLWFALAIFLIMTNFLQVINWICKFNVGFHRNDPIKLVIFDKAFSKINLLTQIISTCLFCSTNNTLQHLWVFNIHKYLSLTTKNPQQIQLPLCGFQVVTSACITACYITINRICCNNRMNCRDLHMGVFTIGVPKKNDLVFKGQQRTTLDICLAYIIIVVVDCCMPIDKMMFC